jgi:hypothetical protein
MPTVKNVPAILEKIISGTAPSKFTTSHLKNIGFPSSNDRAIIPILKDLGFLAADGTPTKRYHDYRNAAHSRTVLGDALRDAYEDVFHINASPTKTDREAIKGTFKSVNNVADNIAGLQTMTFFAFLDKADLSGGASDKGDKAKKIKPPKQQVENDDGEEDQGEKPVHSQGSGRSLQLRHNIEVHLPATKEIEVYSAIFKALRENLLD